VSGLSLGLGFLGKYSMLLALPCVAIASVHTPALHRALRTRPPYVALVIAALLATPVIAWNVQHHWVSVFHVGTLAGFSMPVFFAPASMWKFVGGQLGVVTPLLLALMCIVLTSVGRAAIRGADTHATWWLWSVSAPPLIFFLVLSCVTDVEANWAAPAYAGALVLTAAWLDARFETLLTSSTDRNSLGAGTLSYLTVLMLLVLTGWSINVVAHCPALLPRIGIELPARFDPTARLLGWSDLGAAVGRAQAREPVATFIMSESYQVASALAFYVPGQPRVYNVDLGRRMNQYDVWGGLDALIGRDGLYVTAGRWDGAHPIRIACAHLEPVEIVEIARRGQVLRTFSILRCRGFRDMPRAAPRTY
jgi:undecaprenyl-diphosphatase